MTEWFATLVPALGTALLHFLWQGALVGVLAWAALALLHGARPQARYAVACLALLACVLLPLWGLAQAIAGHGASSGVAPALSSQADAVAGTAFGAPAIGTIADRFAGTLDAALPWIVSLWAAGASLLSLRMAFGLAWIRALRDASHAPSEGDWQARLDRLARRMGISRAVSLRVLPDGDGPVSIGWWRPLVLVPAALLARMPTDLLEALLAHELAHVRRHDYLVNLLQGVAEALLFYHPVTWWLSRRIRVEREQVADALAARALGEPRRLAVALSELDRFALPPARFALAAHGGQLMSRIQQLIRPNHRNVGARFALPAIGLVTVCLAFYAHGQIAQRAQPAVAATAAAAPTAAGAAQAAALPVPAARATPVLGAVTAVPASAASAITRIQNDNPQPYAIVEAGRDGFAMSGSMDDIEEIRAAQRTIGGDFLWFRRDGQAYMVRDPAVLARIERERGPARVLEQKMEALGEQMETHSTKMEEFSERMEALSDVPADTPAMRESAKRMQALGERQAALAQRQMALAQSMTAADEAARESLEAQMEGLDAQQEALGEEMDRLGETLDAESSKLEANQAPMEALGRQMEEAGKPMEALGKQMEVVGKDLERAVAASEASIRALIDESLGNGLATPLPRSQ